MQRSIYEEIVGSSSSFIGLAAIEKVAHGVYGFNHRETGTGKSCAHAIHAAYVPTCA